MSGLIQPDKRGFTDNFYGWAKGAYESSGFTFASGALLDGEPLEVNQLRIGGPRENDADSYKPDEPKAMYRSLGCYLSARDQVQLMVKCVEAEDIRDEHGVPFQIFYSASGNMRKFWDLSNARRVIDYELEDDSAVKFADRIAEILAQRRQMT